MKRILIMEDDPVTAHVYRTRLEKEGYEVTVAPDGQTGLARFSELRPDGVLLDLMMPKAGGIDVLKKIRAMDDFKNLPIIAYTNGFVPKMVEDALAAGATRVFDKSTVTAPMVILAFEEAAGSDKS